MDYSPARSLKLFSPDRVVLFRERPHRFLVRGEDPETGEVLSAHCPNPGRMKEFMLPGMPLVLEAAPPAAESRKTAWGLVAVIYKKMVIPLHSVKANLLARRLLLPKLFPQGTCFKKEVTVGNSRFDWLARTGQGEETYIEVKCCTLVEENRCLFPDAPSVRATKHLNHLSELESGMVLFLVMNPLTEEWAPNLHTDPVFAETLGLVSRKVQIRAASVRCTRGGLVSVYRENIPVNLDPAREAVQDRGVYQLHLSLSQDQHIKIGSLGSLFFAKGFYVYTGSARKNLSARINRHVGKRKKIRWHIDYLRHKASQCRAFPIRTAKQDLEFPLARETARCGQVIPGFGSSDSPVPGHLVYFPDNPLYNTSYRNLLFHYCHTVAF